MKKALNPKKVNLPLIFILVSILFSVPYSFAEEKITLTTYYPAPYGIYKELRVNQMAVGSTYRNRNIGIVGGEDGTLVVSGKVGIGTTSPGAKLSFNNLNDGTNGADGITWYNPAPTAYGIYRSAGDWSDPFQQLTLSWVTGIMLNPGTAYGKSYVDIQGGGLRVTSGNVGIGTTNPGYLLTLKGTSAQTIGMERNPTYNAAGKNLTLRAGDANNQTQNLAGGNLYLSSGASRGDQGSNMYFQTTTAGGSGMYDRIPDTKMTILGSGNVGIGTASPGAKLSVNGGISAGSYYSTTAPPSGMIISGNVGIGIDNPLAKLHIQNNSSTTAITNPSDSLRIYDDAPQIDFVDSNNNDWAIHVNSNKMYFIRQPWNYTDLVLDGTGKVGIGTASPNANLEVNGSFYPKITVYFRARNSSGCTDLGDWAFCTLAKLSGMRWESNDTWGKCSVHIGTTQDNPTDLMTRTYSGKGPTGSEQWRICNSQDGTKPDVDCTAMCLKFE